MSTPRRARTNLPSVRQDRRRTMGGTGVDRAVQDLDRAVRDQAARSGGPVTLTFNDGRTVKVDGTRGLAGAQGSAAVADAVQAWLRECCDLRNDGGFSHPGYLPHDPADPPREKPRLAFKAGPGPKLFSEPPKLRGAYTNRPHTFREEARGVASWRQAGRAKPLDTVPAWVPCPPRDRALKVPEPSFRVGRPRDTKPRTAPPEPYEDAERARRALDRGIRSAQPTSGRKPFSGSSRPRDFFNDAPALRPMPATRSLTVRPRSIKRPVFRNKSDFFGEFPRHIADPLPESSPREPIRQCMVSCYNSSGVSRSIMIK
eukprot:TRINITY_DN4269_c0_g1_i1.p1 TRINITY_DN4269_c0_g1~~TRINITY_DN4269_c0_g1_i1.p1  ORF type:complete len:315 (+),score=104.33 TRINITY_DN4269_c0_g1_i1:381-1325(+)